MFRWRWITALWIIVACKQPAIPTPVTHAPIPSPTLLPLTLSDYLKINFPQWQVVEKTDYSNTWWSFYDSSYNPCWARTDINDDQLADYAIWLKNNNQFRLVICTGTASHTFTHYIADNINAPFNANKHNLETGVAVAPPAQIDVVSPRLQSLILQSNGFVLMELEVRTCIYYWQNDRLQTFYMK